MYPRKQQARQGSGSSTRQPNTPTSQPVEPVHTQALDTVTGGASGELLSRNVLQLQQTVGNRAVSRQVNNRAVQRIPSGGPARIQRNFMDQKDKADALKKATSEHKLNDEQMEAVGHVLEAVVFYQKVDAGVVKPERFTQVKNALKDIIADINHYSGRLPKEVAGIMAQLKSEVQVVIDDWLFAQWLLEDMAKDGWDKDADNVGNAVREVDARFKKYGASSKYVNNGIIVILDMVRAKATEAMRAWQKNKKLKPGGFDYGDAQGKLTKELKGYMKDYGQIEQFLADKSNLLFYMRELAKLIHGQEDKVGALKAELGRVETRAGFEPKPVVPLGILPADAFFGLLAQGRVLDDYGAGLQHGELSHRMQWYAICRAAEEKHIKKLKHSPVDLYRALGRPPFNQARSGSSMWGYLLDSSINPSESSYRFPGTLNRDLLQSDPKWDQDGPGQQGYRVVKEYKLPDTSGLEPLGQALSELKIIRTKEMMKADPEALKSDDWARFGTPTPKAVESKKQELTKEGYKEHQSGVIESKSAFSSESESSRWEVLIAP